MTDRSSPVQLGLDTCGEGGKGDILNNSIGGEVKRVSVFGGQAFVKPLVYPILQVKVLSQRSAGRC